MNNILYINAGAGSGKTYRLTHDLADFLTGQNENEHNPAQAIIKPSEVIVATYTKAAANEIKERARKVLLEKNRVEDATQLETASIGTIHGVAQQFINKYWYLIDACPNQDVLTDEDKDIYRNQSLANLFANRDFTEARLAIRRYFEEFQPQKSVGDYSVPYPDFWATHVDAIVHKATYYGVKDFARSIQESCDEIDRLFCVDKTIDVNLYARLYDKARNALCEKVNATHTDGSAKALGELSGLPTSPSFSALNKMYTIVSGQVTKEFPFEELLSELSVFLRGKQFGTILKDCVKAVFAIAQAWMQDYADFKRRLGVIDYDDMEKGFLRLLGIQSVRDEIAANYKLVLIDEFQDCNPMQLRIFSQISDIVASKSCLPYSSIWVGDPNQAIYGFRGSDTQLVSRVKDKFTAKYPAKTVDPKKEFDGLSLDSLDKSYRSCPSLVRYASNLFSTLLPDFTPLTPHRNEVDGLQTAVLQWHFQKADAHDNNHMRALGRHIKGLVERSANAEATDKQFVLDKDKGELRPIQYKDIAVLANTNAEISKLVAVLREEGVPASAPESDILDRAEVQLILAMLNLRAKDNKERPHEVATLLKLWSDQSTEQVLQSRVDNTNATWSETQTALAPIRLALDHAKGLPMDKKIATLILELDIYNRVEKWGDGDVRRQNLMTLQTVAQQFVARCTRMHLSPTEHEFHLYLQTASINPDKDTLSDSVRVHTYHGSKGLEWPMVILYSLDADPFDKFLPREYYGVHEVQCGESRVSAEIIRPYYIFYMPALATSSVKVLEADIEQSEPYYKAPRERVIAERKRLFYVGLTRARDYLVYYATPTYSTTSKAYSLKWESNFKWLYTIGLIPEGSSTDGSNPDDSKPCPINLGQCQVFDPIIPPAPKEPKAPKYPDPVTDRKLKNYEAKKAEYDADMIVYQAALEEHGALVASEKERQQKKMSYTLHAIGDLREDAQPDKYIHPSTETGRDDAEKDNCTYMLQLLPQAKRIGIPSPGEGHYYRADRFGSCIHNIYAVSPDNLASLQPEQKAAYASTANAIIGNYHLSHIITDAEALVDNLASLFSWLQTQFGAPTSIVHEFPFSYPYGEQQEQVIRGEIDMVYCTPQIDVIIDFKTYVGDADTLSDPADDGRYNAHFINKHYRPQLTKYREIWSQAHPGKSIRTFLYYNVLGGVVEIE